MTEAGQSITSRPITKLRFVAESEQRFLTSLSLSRPSDFEHLIR